MHRAIMLLSLLSACSSGRDPEVHPDAPGGDAIPDAPSTCTPAAEPRERAPACLALEPSPLSGSTPRGNLDAALDYFGAGDCITISQATIVWRDACGEPFRLRFPYPVVASAGGRSVTGSFDADARFEDQLTTIHVEVARWQEGNGVHEIDVIVTFADPAYLLAPQRIRGTFCDWPYHVC